tara:strand:- start:525 stop:1493 length:969 start_codon:yes stop_codon:yes gene_type:complete
MEKMLYKNSPKIRQDFFCEKCDYICSKKSDYKKHIESKKHNAIKCYTNATSKFANFVCSCGKQYKHSSSFYRHKSICKFIEDNADKEDNMSTDYDTNSIVHLLKQNKEFKDLLIEQNKMMVNQQTENQNLQKQLIEVVKDNGKIINNTTNNTMNNTTNNNQKFNLNFFLNTTCKDAMNMSEFIENINIEFQDIEDIGRNGYVTGMTKMILSRIKDMDVTKRPLHCTDLKRETMYIKDNNEWSKDTPENAKLKKMITIVAKQNYKTIPLWREKYPECQDWNNPKYDFSIDMMRNILGELGDEQIRLDNKIIKNLSKHVLVERN